MLLSGIMKIALLTRKGDCFPNIIAKGLGELFKEHSVEAKIFEEAIPFLMRLLPLSKQPKHWHNNLHYRLYNKAKYRQKDAALLRELAQYDIIILAECLPNAYWKNYLAIEELRELIGKPIFSYTDAYYQNAPLHRKIWFDANDYDERRYDCNLTPSPVTELRLKPNGNCTTTAR